MTNDAIKDVVQLIMEQADEILALKDRDDVEYGQLLGLSEALNIIQDAVDLDSRKEIGLDFDIDERYLVET